VVFVRDLCEVVRDDPTDVGRTTGCPCLIQDAVASCLTRDVSLAASVAIDGHQGDTDGDPSDPERRRADVCYEQDRTSEQEGYGDPGEGLPHGRYLPANLRTFSFDVVA
jgi:hypothetical protein